MIAFVRRQLSPEIMYLAALGVFVVGFAAFICISAFNYRPVITLPTVAELPPMPMAPPAPTSNPDADSYNNAPPSFTPDQPSVDATPPAQAPIAPTRPRPRFGGNAPLPPQRPADIDIPADVPVPAPRPHDELNASKPTVARKDSGGIQVAPFFPPGRYDQFTAVYDLKAHTVYLPNGLRLEAHSGLGPLLDDPRYVNEKDRGPTPPHLYVLTQREELFHGVEALRLNPVGDGDLFGRNGLLAHTYMLGPNGDSNGCVSFKDYDRFLEAYKSGLVKRLAVVAGLDGTPDFPRQ